jgi:hydroxymethylbilane synthase
LKNLEDPATAACVRAERRVSRALGGSCTIPLAAYAEARGSKLHLRALVASPDGRRIARAEREGALSDAEALGATVADDLRARGAEEILASIGK